MADRGVQLSPRLRPGDRVAVVAPAAQIPRTERELVGRGITLLESWGLRVDLRIEQGNRFYLAGDDSVRAAHLNAVLADDGIVAIFCMRGGYGSARILRLLDPTISSAPKFIVGYSDITTLHLGLPRMWPQIVPVHGPNLATPQLLGDGESSEANRRALHAALFSETWRFTSSAPFLRTGRARGPLIGGCLSLVVGTLGTPFAPRTEGRVLFLEDSGEAPYRIDRMLTHLRNAGVLESVAGIAFGSLRGCVDPYNNVNDVIRDLFSDLNIPVVVGLPCGHGETNLALRFGANVEMNSDTETGDALA